MWPPIKERKPKKDKTAKPDSIDVLEGGIAARAKKKASRKAPTGGSSFMPAPSVHVAVKLKPKPLPPKVIKDDGGKVHLVAVVEAEPEAKGVKDDLGPSDGSESESESSEADSVSDDGVPVPPPPLPPPARPPQEPPIPEPAPQPAPEPVPPPPAPHPAGPARARHRPDRHEYEQCPVLDEHGVQIGYILFNENAGSLDAHCWRHKGGPLACNVNRSLKKRPLGFLVAWLRCGFHETIPDGAVGRPAHTDAHKFMKAPFEFLKDGTSRERLAGRDWCEGPGRDFMEPLLRIERKKGPREPLEPPGRV